jgi:hypothetical protein
MKTLTLTLMILASMAYNASHAQISEADSTVQVIGYWSKNDKQSFSFKSDKYSVTGSDTTERETIITAIDITVLDSTANSYTVEWLYKSVKSNTSNPLMKKFYPLAQNVKFIIKTDEMGSFTELLNVHELQDYSVRTAATLKKELKGMAGAEAFIKMFQQTFATKESIENELIDEIYQFYYFHGGKYKMGEPVTTQLQLPNAGGGKPLDAELVIQVSEINAADDNYVIHSWQTVDPAQATEATYQVLMKTNELGKDFSRDQMPDVTIEDTIGTRIHVSGWTIYSIKTRTVTTGDRADIHEWTFEIQ